MDNLPRTSTPKYFFGVIAAGVLMGAPYDAAAGKPGSTPDPCAATNLVFPAFTYRNQTSANGNQLLTIYIADSTGACSRPIATAATILVGPRFAYPVSGTSNQGRVVWREGETFYGVDFFVTQPGNQVTVGTRQALYGTVAEPAGTAADLSKDGLTFYFTMNPTDTVLASASLGSVLPSNPAPTPIYTLDSTWFWENISVSDDGTMIFADVVGQGTNAGSVKLARLDVMTSTLNTLRINTVNANYWPAIGTYGSTPTLAYVEYLSGLDNCTQLIIADTNGSSNPAFTAIRYGTFLTWVGGNVVMQQRNPPDKRGTCASTSTISRVNLADGSQTVLTTGFDPDGD